MILFVFLETFAFLISRATIALVDIQIPLLRPPYGFPRAVDWYKPWMHGKIPFTIYLYFHELAFRPHKASESAHSYEYYYFV